MSFSMWYRYFTVKAYFRLYWWEIVKLLAVFVFGMLVMQLMG